MRGNGEQVRGCQQSCEIITHSDIKGRRDRMMAASQITIQFKECLGRPSESLQVKVPDQRSFSSSRSKLAQYSSCTHHWLAAVPSKHNLGEKEAMAAELPTAQSEVTGNPLPSNMASPFLEGGWPGALNPTGICPYSCLSIYEFFSVQSLLGCDRKPRKSMRPLCFRNSWEHHSFIYLN